MTEPMSLEYPNLTSMSDMDLVLLAADARKNGDKDFLHAVLTELGRRETQRSRQCATPGGQP